MNNLKERTSENMKTYRLSIEELNAIFLALVGAEQRATGRAARMYGEVQTKIRELAREATKADDFELVLEVLNV